MEMSAMRGNEQGVVVGLDQKKLMKEDGVEVLLKELEKSYQNENRIYRLTNLKEFYNIRRDPEGGEGLALTGKSWVGGAVGASSGRGLSLPGRIRPYQGRTDENIR